MTLRRLLLIGGGALAAFVLAVGGYRLARHDRVVLRGPVAVSSSPDQIPSTPTSEAPPFMIPISAIGCAQKVTATVSAGNSVLVQNTGKIQLRLSGGPLSTPEWPLAPGAWIHFRLGAPAVYRITGARYSCTNAGIPGPHFTLDVTVTSP